MTITIRHARPDDYEAVHRIFSGRQAVWGTLQLPFPSTELWRKRLAEPAEGRYMLLACAEDEVVGNLGLKVNSSPRRRHVADLGMAVRDDWQGKGVGSALMVAALDLADNWLNIVRVELSVYTDNAAAIALYTRFGFVVEGTERYHAFRDGRYVDSHMMARIRPGFAVEPSQEEG